MIGEIRREATRVLLSNWRGGSTVPARGLYPHQWSWDSAFIAIGLRHLSVLRAQKELESLFGAQWQDGRVPHIVFDAATDSNAYFPGPEFWSSCRHGGPPRQSTSGLVQPPVHATAVRKVFEANPTAACRRGFLERLYPRLVAWHGYLTRQRGLSGNGLVAIVHPWESGMDNSPAWDEPLSRVEPAGAGTFRRRDLGHAGDGERPTDLDYGRYVRLASTYRDHGYRDGALTHEFAVEDPLTNALLASSEADLAEIAARVGADPAPHRAEVERMRHHMVEHLYCSAAGMFFPRDVNTGALIRQPTVAGLVPLVVPDLPVVERLVDTAFGELFRPDHPGPITSYARNGDSFEPSRYWRGPGWFNTSWLIWHGLRRHGRHAEAGRLRRDVLEAVERVGFREYVNPVAGDGRGAVDFSWTASAALDFARTEG